LFGLEPDFDDAARRWKGDSQLNLSVSSIQLRADGGSLTPK
jgi:hypothetical protein